MTMPFYVSPEQVLKDRGDYARKGVSRGRSLAAFEYADGIAIVADNPSRTLYKVSEIYDRIGFAGVGKYSDFQQLKIAGVRHADLKGFSYSREDVNVYSLANVYAQTLGQVFVHELKPFEVEILVVQVGTDDNPDNEMFQITYDGTIIDKNRFAALGGEAERITEALEERYNDGMSLAEVIQLGADVLRNDEEDQDPLTAERLEVATLERSRKGRAFRRIKGDDLAALLS